MDRQTKDTTTGVLLWLGVLLVCFAFWVGVITIAGWTGS